MLNNNNNWEEPTNLELPDILLTEGKLKLSILKYEVLSNEYFSEIQVSEEEVKKIRL